MRRLLTILGLVAVLMISGCVPGIDKSDDEVVQDTEEAAEETVIIPDVQLKGEYYRTLLPFKKSASRGLIVNNIHTKYDMREVEEGLLRLSTQRFSPDDHFFQEGQYITQEMAMSWIRRKSEDNPEGLNPAVTAKMKDDEIADKAPIYLAHIVEQNYLVMTKENKVRLDGISIGLAMNSIYYARAGKETAISDSVLEEQGMLMGEEIVKRLRSIEGLEDIPIVVGLFKQESNNSITPGHYFATVVAEGGKGPSGWKKVDEKHVIFPSSTNDEKHRDVNTAFRNFKQAIDDYFPSFVNVIGRGHYANGSLRSLEIEVPIQFYGTSEIIGFVQYLTSQIPKYLPDVHIEVSVTSINGPEALIVKESGEEEPYVHIYGY
ncbi:CamS family sex pheromone protein [Sporosarcina pasteurii]|nr:CamS family sex pheromone protein [Sporosarcina pasteurii]QBQ06996.1 CamS family sex pheromone protein [Sporosarcina pasteurii]